MSTCRLVIFAEAWHVILAQENQEVESSRARLLGARCSHHVRSQGPPAQSFLSNLENFNFLLVSCLTRYDRLLSALKSLIPHPRSLVSGDWVGNFWYFHRSSRGLNCAIKCSIPL